MSNPPTPANWQWGPLPQVSGWFAVLRCWDPTEGFFPDAAWVHHGKVAWPNDGGIFFSNATYAGPFPTEKEAQSWAEAHDVM